MKDISITFPSLKCHLFEPSKKIIWTIIGKQYEYWIDLDLGYCSCNDYYYRTLSNKSICYHLDFVKEKNSKFETIQFSDMEYYDFIKAVVNDSCLMIRKEIV